MLGKTLRIDHETNGNSIKTNHIFGRLLYITPTHPL